jgi:hypothetical protein
MASSAARETAVVIAFRKIGYALVRFHVIVGQEKPATTACVAPETVGMAVCVAPKPSALKIIVVLPHEPSIFVCSCATRIFAILREIPVKRALRMPTAVLERVALNWRARRFA